MNLIYMTIDDMRIPPNIKSELETVVVGINNTIKSFYDELFQFTAQSDALDLFLKVLLCGSPYGVSPFITSTPSPLWWGWLNDPLLLEITEIINRIENKTGQEIPWTAAVPGASTNWTSPEDMKRRVMPNLMKTGKKNNLQVSQYRKFNNMEYLYACISPMKSQNASAYTEGDEFPACAHFNSSWTNEEAEAAGYVHPFETPFSNVIEGTDGNMFGRPVLSEYIRIFSLDIYRSGYMKHTGNNDDWHGVFLRRYGIDEADTNNATINPGNAQFYANCPKGLLNLTKAVNTPVFSSFPHFLHGSDELVAAISGLHPNKQAHDSWIDLEPQTGLICRANKRIQSNYRMTNKHLPEMQPSALNQANYICSNISALISLVNSINATNLTAPDCELIVATELLTCLMQPSTWTLQNGEIYMPFGWVEEGIQLDEDQANELKNDLFFAEHFGQRLQFWCLLIAGWLFATIVAIALDAALFAKKVKDFYGVDISMFDVGAGGRHDRHYVGLYHPSKKEPLLEESSAHEDVGLLANRYQQQQPQSQI